MASKLYLSQCEPQSGSHHLMHTMPHNCGEDLAGGVVAPAAHRNNRPVRYDLRDRKTILHTRRSAHTRCARASFAGISTPGFKIPFGSTRSLIPASALMNVSGI